MMYDGAKRQVHKERAAQKNDGRSGEPAVQDSLPPFSFTERFYRQLRHTEHSTVEYTAHQTNESFDSISQPVLASTNGKVALLLKEQ